MPHKHISGEKAVWCPLGNCEELQLGVAMMLSFLCCEACISFGVTQAKYYILMVLWDGEWTRLDYRDLVARQNRTVLVSTVF